jgi:O-antigen chain-terminating methyltransferase
MVTSFHLIEHLPFRTLIDLLRQIQRVLLPGGLTILETPNPRNILVGASDFFRDMTHNNPIHPDSLRFALETLGMKDVACYFLQDEGSRRTAIRADEFVFNDLQSYVSVPRDFAAIARKP